MLRKVISGGQAGVDQAALRAARAAGLEAGGTMPHGWRTRDGPRPDLATEFGLEEDACRHSIRYTRSNVNAADTTLLIVGESAPVRFSLVVRWCGEQNKGLIEICDQAPVGPTMLARHLRLLRVQVLNVAGSFEQTRTGIAARMESYLAHAFRLAMRNDR